jgi:DNA-binding IclR family transcriptional regulator
MPSFSTKLLYLSQRAPLVVEDIAHALRRPARLGVLDGAQGANIKKVPGNLPVSLFSAAARLPAHATALGKALLAFSCPDITNPAISFSLPGYTARTLTRSDQLDYVLHQTRRNGIATDSGELHPRTRAIAVPVLDADDTAIAAIRVQVNDLSPSTLADLSPALTLAARGLSRARHRSSAPTEPAVAPLRSPTDHREGDRTAAG